MAAFIEAGERVGKEIELGFVEEAASESLLSYQLPSKVGGLPAWLSLKPLPSLNQLQCKKCGDPVVFLLQVYAPRDECELTFHRTIFIFICRNPLCCTNNGNDNFMVFRSQLPRKNDFYSFEPPKDAVLVNTDEQPHARQFQSLCVICGGNGPKKCGRCHKVSYCSKKHQTIDWKAIHKTICKAESDKSPVKSGAQILSFKHPNVLFPELELVTEPEECTQDDENAEKDTMQGYREFLASESSKSISNDLDTDELDKAASKLSQDDEQFFKFKKRICHDQEQVLRFDRGGEPLWISALNKPQHIPQCSCGSERVFEFQVLPQLLCHLDVDSVGESIDWGVLCVYTCEQNCDIGNNYHEEFLWKQDIVSKTEV